MPLVVGALLALGSGGIVVAGTTITLGSIASALVTSLVVNAVSRALFKPDMPDLGTLGDIARDRTVTVRQPITERRIVYGRVKTGGTIVFMDTTGNNKYLHLVIVFADHEIDAFEAIYLNDTQVVPGTGGYVTSGRYANRVRVKQYLGTATQTADPDLVNESSQWTTSHRLQGMAYLYVRLEYDQDVFPTGVPNISATIRGKKVYDPRSATTAWSDNAALCTADYLTDTRFGLSVDYASGIDEATLIAAANTCDEAVTLAAGGTEKRYTVNGVVKTSESPERILEQLNSAKSAPTAYIMGKWYVQAGAWQAAAVTLTDDDFLRPLRVVTRLPRRELANAVKGVYISPANNWQPADYPPITNSTYEAQDGGVRIWRDLDLPYTTSAATAQRLAKIALEKARQQISVQARATLKALDVVPGDVIQITHPRFGWTNKPFEVTHFRFVAEDTDQGAILAVDLDLKETASTVYDWNANETTVDPAPNTNLPDPFTVLAPTNLVLTTGGSVAQVAQDGTVIARILVEWTASLDAFVDHYEVQWKQPTETQWNSVKLSRDTTDYIISPVQSGASYDVRVRAINTLGVASAWLTSNTSAAGKNLAPGAPSGLTATGKPESVILTWTNPSDADLDIIEVYASTTSNFADGAVVGRIRGDTFVHDVPAGQTRYYWIRALDTSGNSSAWHPADTGPGVAGTASTAGVTFNDITTYIANVRSLFNDDDFANWNGNGASGNSLTRVTDAYSATYAGQFSSTNSAPASSGTTEGAYFTIDPAVAQAWAGNRIRVQWQAKAPASGASANYAVAVSWNTGDSGWQSFAVPSSWTQHGFLVDLPQGVTQLYIGVWGDTSGGGGAVLIDNLDVFIVPEKITSTNIDQWIGALAVGDAYIANLDGAKITATSITADKLSVTYLSSVTSQTGALEVDSTGSIRGGQKAFNTGAGFWLGYDAGVYKFSFGNASGEYLYWDGNNLFASGQIFPKPWEPGTFYTVDAGASVSRSSSATDGLVVTKVYEWACATRYGTVRMTIPWSVANTGSGGNMYIYLRKYKNGSLLDDAQVYGGAQSNQSGTHYYDVQVSPGDVLMVEMAQSLVLGSGTITMTANGSIQNNFRIYDERLYP